MEYGMKTIGIRVALAVLVTTSARAGSYKPAKGSEVTFVAKITASSFEAKSEALAGTVDFDAAGATVHSAAITVKADSFETGVGMRDGHMRDKYLEASKFPLIRLDLGEVKVPAA